MIASELAALGSAWTSALKNIGVVKYGPVVAVAMGPPIMLPPPAPLPPSVAVPPVSAPPVTPPLVSSPLGSSPAIVAPHAAVRKNPSVTIARMRQQSTRGGTTRAGEHAIQKIVDASLCFRLPGSLTLAGAGNTELRAGDEKAGSRAPCRPGLRLSPRSGAACRSG